MLCIVEQIIQAKMENFIAVYKTNKLKYKNIILYLI